MENADRGIGVKQVPHFLGCTERYAPDIFEFCSAAENVKFVLAHLWVPGSDAPELF